MSQLRRVSVSLKTSPTAIQTPESVVLTTLDNAVNWMRRIPFGPYFRPRLRRIEMMSMGLSRFDIARFGAEVFRPSPRQSDLMNHRRPRLQQNGAGDSPALGAECPNRSGSSPWAPAPPSGGVFNNYALGAERESGDSSWTFMFQAVTPTVLSS